MKEHPAYYEPMWVTDEVAHDEWHITSNEDNQDNCPWGCVYRGEKSVQRVAVVTGGARDLEQVQRFLPQNYEAAEAEGQIVIFGEDNRGWTLDGYVIPRLASGMIYAVEVV